MSDEAQRPLDMRAILTRIDRDLAESAKLRAESEKFVAEQRKLIAEEGKLTCDRWLGQRSLLLRSLVACWAWRPSSPT